MQFYQKRRENCVKTHVILKKASFYACLTLFAGMAFPMPLWVEKPLNFDPFGHAELSLFAKI